MNGEQRLICVFLCVAILSMASCTAIGDYARHMHPECTAQGKTAAKENEQ